MVRTAARWVAGDASGEPSGHTHGVFACLQVLSDATLVSMEQGELFARVLKELNHRHGHDESDNPELQSGASAAGRRFNWSLLAPCLGAYGVPVDDDTMELVLAGGACACTCAAVVGG